MKAQHPLDDLFRSQLDEYQMEAPMHLWDGVAQRSKRPNSKPHRRFLLLAGLLAWSYALFLQADTRMISNRTTPNNLPFIATPSLPQALQAPPTRADQATTEPGASLMASALPTPSSNVRTPRRSGGGSRKKQAAYRTVLPGISADNPIAASLPDTAEQTAVTNRETLPEVPPIPALQAQLELAPIQDFIPGIRFLGERWYASFDIALAQEWAHRTLLPIAPEYQPYADLRESSEVFQSAQAAAIRLSLISASGITMKSGIQVTRITETFTQTRNEQKITLTPITNSNGQVIRTDTSIQNLEFTWSTRNQFHTIDIPVLLGYEFAFGQLNIGLSGGPVLNMAFNQKGTFFGPDGKTALDFSSNQPDAYPAFKNRLGVGWYGSAQLSFPITPSIRVLAEPYFRVFPQSYTNRDYVLEQHYRSAGIFVGIRKLLGPYWLNLRP